MHVVLHTQYYPPEIGAPQARLSALAHGFIKRGHKVTVLTAMPNYPQGVLHAGYRGMLKVEEMDGARLIRSWIYPTNSVSLARRLFGYFSFVLSSLVAGLIFLKAVDIILTESPPLFLGMSGYLLSRAKRARWIFNVSDLWPESAVRLGLIRDGLALRLSYGLEAFCYRKAWCVSGQSRETLESIRSRFPHVSTYHLSNGTDTTLFAPERRSLRLRHEVGDGIIALYAGLHGLAQGLERVLLAAQQLVDIPDLKIVFLGDGPLKKRLMEEARALGLGNVYFLNPLPRSEMPGVLASADFCLVPLATELPGAVPSKLYEAMSAGKAVALMAQGEAAEIVERHGCGIVVAPGDVEGLASAIRTLATDAGLREHLGARGRSAALEHYDRSAITEAFVQFVETFGQGKP